MPPPEWSGDDLVAALLAPVEPPFAGGLVVVTSPPSAGPDERRRAVERLAVLPSVVMAAPGTELDTVADLVDLAAGDDRELADVEAVVARTPLAAVSAAVLLRGSESRPVAEGLQVESAVFAALQGGPEHREWLGGRSRPARPADTGGDAPRVRAERRGDLLVVSLQRPAARNALDARMRDELSEVLSVAEADPALAVELRGDGPSFCAGGDLDEFGTTPDPATAHVVRLRRSLGAVLHRLSDRLTVRVHGRCAGSGVELAAFAGRVVARPGTTFVLPELGMGLVPGAGGTLSLPRRIGRHRTAWMVFTGRSVDAGIARSWGLVDEFDLV